MLQSQARLKEIHRKLLHMHLQRLERPLESEDHFENDLELKPEEEEVSDDQEGKEALLIQFVLHVLYNCFGGKKWSSDQHFDDRCSTLFT